MKIEWMELQPRILIWDYHLVPNFDLIRTQQFTTQFKSELSPC